MRKDWWLRSFWMESSDNGWSNRLSVTVGEFVATGCGQSKKKAKHSAAKWALETHNYRSIFIKVITQVNIGQVDWGPEFWKSACRPTNHSRSCNWGELRVKIDFITTIHESMSSLKVLSPYDDGIQGNPVGLLQVCYICVQKILHLKNYKLLLGALYVKTVASAHLWSQPRRR